MEAKRIGKLMIIKVYDNENCPLLIMNNIFYYSPSFYIRDDYFKDTYFTFISGLYLEPDIRRSLYSNVYLAEIINDKSDFLIQARVIDEI